MKSEFRYNINDWLPISKKEIENRAWNQPDVILISGDAYIDHPSFGTAVIGRIIENLGLKVAIVPQPNWKDDLRDFKKFGPPKLFFGISAGSMDSMVNHYTAYKRLRSDDAYTPGGKAGFRPDYAVSVYSKILKSIYPDIPVIIGGIEASLRRYTHYDYWSDKLKCSILKESSADFLVYGMGEVAIKEIVLNIQKKGNFSEINSINQVCYLTDKSTFKSNPDDIKLFSHEDCLKDKKKYADNFVKIETESNKFKGNRIIQEIGKQILVVNPPNPLIEQEELDKIYDLPFTRLPHPKYFKKGNIPAYEMIKFSVNIHRGCFGGCSFCTISAHQGKFISSRSETSILKEIEKIKSLTDFAGHISDLGGPSANMYKMKGLNQDICKNCSKASCIFPKLCSNLICNHDYLNKLYKKVRELNGIKKVSIGSGVRYDLFAERNKSNDIYKENLIRFHTSGRLKVAPEHCSDTILNLIRKPNFKYYIEFLAEFNRVNRKYGLRQELVPYFISSLPGSTIQEMNELSEVLRKYNIRPEQVQDFTPTPMTLATEIFYLGFNPYTGKAVFTEHDIEKKRKQKEKLFWYKRNF